MEAHLLAIYLLTLFLYGAYTDYIHNVFWYTILHIIGREVGTIHTSEMSLGFQIRGANSNVVGIICPLWFE
jgi:hypothetical protein